MYAARRWAVRHARFMETLYLMFEPVFVWLHPLWLKLGYNRVEKPIVAVERAVKGILFDCQMCGQCVLSVTGMSCPMNCPKSIRNGPCGGVRPDGSCEVKPDMRCVWVEAWEGSKRMRNSDKIFVVQQPVNHSYQNTSSWLRVVKDFVTNKKEKVADVRAER